MNFPTQNDWVSTILEELNKLEIDLELEEIQLLSKKIPHTGDKECLN